MEYVLITYVILTVASLTFGQVTQPGRCPNIPTPRDFNIQSFLGPWWGVEQFSEFKRIDLACPAININLNTNYTIRMEKIDFNLVNNSYQRIDHTATVINALDPAKWLVRDPQEQFPYPYWILDTDYRLFAVTWSCIDLFNGNHIEHLYLLSRVRFGLPRYVRFLIYRYLQAHGIDTRNLVSNDRVTCLMPQSNDADRARSF